MKIKSFIIGLICLPIYVVIFIVKEFSSYYWYKYNVIKYEVGKFSHYLIKDFCNFGDFILGANNVKQYNN